MNEKPLNFLAETQNPDGGWGYYPGKGSAPEPTAYALMGLPSQADLKAARQRAWSFLKTRQLPGGGWSVGLTDNEPAAWVSALVGHALMLEEGLSSACQAASAFVLQSFGKVPIAWWMRLPVALGNKSAFPFDTSLGGWAWNPRTTPWVEPTCYSLIFLKESQQHRADEKTRRLVDEAERMLYDRMCLEGGWNYGNAKALGEELRPYALTTALALIALQDHARRNENQKSLAYLQRTALVEKSALSLAFSIVALDLYAQKGPELLARLDALTADDGFQKSIKTAAMALVANQINEGRNLFRF